MQWVLCRRCRLSWPINNPGCRSDLNLAPANHAAKLPIAAAIDHGNGTGIEVGRLLFRFELFFTWGFELRRIIGRKRETRLPIFSTADVSSFFFFFLSLVEQLRWEDVNETKQDLALFSPIDVFTIKSCGGAIIRTGSRKDLQLDSLKCLFIAARFMHFEIEGSSCSSSCIRVSNFDECRFYRWVWSEFLNLLERWMKRRKISRLSNVFCTLYVSLFHQFKIFLEYLCTCINTRGRYAATNKNFNTIW